MKTLSNWKLLGIAATLFGMVGGAYNINQYLSERANLSTNVEEIRLQPDLHLVEDLDKLDKKYNNVSNDIIGSSLEKIIQKMIQRQKST
jgi:hypothetical protein